MPIKLWWFFILTLLFFAAFLAAFFASKGTDTFNIRVGGAEIQVEVLSSQPAMARGLGGRDSLAEDHGMLFVYQGEVTPGFWMKDMRFPLDMIWIRHNQVIGIEENVPVVPSGASLPTYFPKEPVTAVLEVNAGVSRKLGIVPGTRLVCPVLDFFSPIC